MLFIALGKKALSPTLAFTANRLTLFFNHIPLTVADCTDHFSLPVSSSYVTIRRIILTDLAYALLMRGWQGKN